MNPTNRKDIRSKKILNVSSKSFENYFDYYVFLHLNKKVLIFHVIGMIVGFLFLGLAIFQMNGFYFLLFLITLNGFPHGSHIVFDGIVSPATGDTKGLSIFYAIKLNFILLSGRYDEFETNFLNKYPFAKDAYLKTEIVAAH